MASQFINLFAKNHLQDHLYGMQFKLKYLDPLVEINLVVCMS